MNISTIHEADSSEAARYRAVLDNAVAKGTSRAASVIQSVYESVPTDQIVPTSRVEFRSVARAADHTQFMVAFDDAEMITVSDHALAQVAERASSPPAYVRELARSIDSWKRDLAADILNRSYANLPRERCLARSVNGQLRGWMSDRYRRIDSRPCLDALVSEAEQVGALPFDGNATETRVAVKIILPRVLEPMPGEFVALGLEWSNSDYGNGTHGVREFLLRVACLNGATRENLLRQIHLGARLADTIEYSDRTLRLDTAASVSALKDVVRGALGPAAVENLAAKLRAAADRQASAATVRGALKSFPKDTVKAAVDAFESNDVLNLPAGPTAWRASNAISWIARHVDDAEKRLDLERAAGALV